MKCLKCKKDIDGKDIYGLHPHCGNDWFHESSTVKDLNFTSLDPKKGSSPSNEDKIHQNKDSFYHGRYLKYSAKLGRANYILKIQEDKFPELPTMEYVCNSIAAHLKFNVPSFHLIRFENKMTFVTRNFMDDYHGVLHHIYKFLPKNSENYTCNNIINALQRETKKLASALTFVEICLFDAFIGNNDRHGRNLGIIETPREKILAPLYDNPSYFGIIDEALLETDIHPSGSVYTSFSEEPKLCDYIKEFEREPFRDICQKFKKKVTDKFPQIIKEVGHSELSPRRKTAFCCFLEKRLGDLERI